MFVYLITNKINGKRYVGQHAGEDLNDYWNRNIWLAENGYQGKRFLYRAIRKYGKDNFDIHPLVIVANKWELDLYEIGLIRAWDLCNSEKGYNLTQGGGGSWGYRPDKETREKMSKSHIGKKMSEENRSKLIERNKGNDYARGRKMSERHFQRLLETHVGAKRTDEARQRMSEAHKGKKQSEETKFKRAAALKGQKRSEETKRKMSEAAKGNGKGSHRRWHLNRNIVNPQCKLCQEVINGLEHQPRIQRDQAESNQSLP